VSRIDDCSAALLSSLLLAVAKLQRRDTALVAACATRAAAIMPTYDPACVAKTLQAMLKLDTVNEELFGALAEQASRVHAQFRMSEIADTLEALSHFELYDSELFPLLASRCIIIMRTRLACDVNDAATVLASFAAVHECNNNLIYSAVKKMQFQLPNLSGAGVVDVLWSFHVLGNKAHGEFATQLAAQSERVASALAVMTPAQKERYKVLAAVYNW
jgi:hypothetical protein